jgi:ADP-ribose pyrophosphatase YjhB (NUDIX family)
MRGYSHFVDPLGTLPLVHRTHGIIVLSICALTNNKTSSYFRHKHYSVVTMVLGSKFISTQKREKIAWVLVVLQTFVMFLAKSPPSAWDYGDEVSNRRLDDGKYDGISLEMNKHSNEYYDRQRINAVANKEALYEPPKVHPAEAGLVSRIWRSNGSPSINSDLQTGSCWCSADDWCMCTPSLAIDVILRSGEDHIWCVRREDTGLLALMGGFTEVGETSEESVHRELKEEMGISLATPPILFGVYNDPLRDSRRHTTSVVYIADVPASAAPKAGDDVTNVIRLPIADVDKHKFFVDHQTIVHDYVTMVERKRRNNSNGDESSAPPEPKSGDNEPFKRSVCPM